MFSCHWRRGLFHAVMALITIDRWSTLIYCELVPAITVLCVFFMYVCILPGRRRKQAVLRIYKTPKRNPPIPPYNQQARRGGRGTRTNDRARQIMQKYWLNTRAPAPPQGSIIQHGVFQAYPATHGPQSQTLPQPQPLTPFPRGKKKKKKKMTS